MKKKIAKIAPKIISEKELPSELPPMNPDDIFLKVSDLKNKKIKIKKDENAQKIIETLKKETKKKNIIGFQCGGKKIFSDTKDLSIFATQKKFDIKLIFDDSNLQNLPSDSDSSPRPPSKFSNKNPSVFYPQVKPIEIEAGNNPNEKPIKVEYPDLAKLDVVNNSTQRTLALINISDSKQYKKTAGIINNFKQSISDYQVLDQLLFLEVKSHAFKCCPYDQLDHFIDECSKIYNSINLAIQYFISNPSELPKRIFLVSDCGNDADEINVIQLCNRLLDNNIILDAIILSDFKTARKNKLLTYIYSISHITGGIFFIPQNDDDAFFFTELEMVVDISNRSFYHSNRKNHIQKLFFERISNNPQFVKKDFFTKKIDSSIYYDMSLISPCYEIDESMKPISHILKEQVEICASYQQKQPKNDIDNFFSIYYLFSEKENKIDSKKAVVFITENKCVYQILIRFPNEFPKVIPSFFLLSKIKLNEICKSNGFINFDINEENPTLLQMLYDLKQALKSCKSKGGEKSELMHSFEEIDSVFHVYCGNKKKKLMFNQSNFKIIT